MDGVSVVVGDRSALVRSLLEAVLARHGITTAGQADTVAELLVIAGEHRPHVVVSDLELVDGSVAHVLGELAALDVRVLLLCPDAPPEALTAALLGGAAGYLLRDTAPAAVADAVRAVADGQAVLHPAAASTILEQWRRLRRTPATPDARRASLTPRERDVLAAMVDGLATKAIARRLGVAVKTVENHKLRVFDKLGVHTNAQAVAVAIAHDLLGGDQVALV